ATVTLPAPRSADTSTIAARMRARWISIKPSPAPWRAGPRPLLAEARIVWRRPREYGVSVLAGISFLLPAVCPLVAWLALLRLLGGFVLGAAGRGYGCAGVYFGAILCEEGGGHREFLGGAYVPVGREGRVFALWQGQFKRSH